MTSVIKDQLFQLDQDGDRLRGLEPATYSGLGILETESLHNWLANNIRMLGDDLFVIQREHYAVNESQRHPDIVALDGSGRIVVIEVKRDPAAGGAVWQSILYASYYQAYSSSEVVDMYREFAELEQEEAKSALLQHLDAEDLADLNSGQRIILVAPEFQPEVSNAALWLSDYSIDIACVELRPYLDKGSGAVFVHLNTVIPLPTRADVGVTARPSRAAERQSIVGGRISKKNDAVSHFMEDVREAAFAKLDEDLRPDNFSRYAGGSGRRWYILWFDEVPWVNHHFCFRVWKSESEEDEFPVEVEFHVWKKGAFGKGASPEIVDAARAAAQDLGKLEGWEFDEPPQKKSFTVRMSIERDEAVDPEIVGDTLAKLIDAISKGIVTDGSTNGSSR